MFKAYITLLAGYFGWGLFPLYWQLLTHVSPMEVTLHRIVWCIPVLALLIHLSRDRQQKFKQSLLSRRELQHLFVTALLITFNWGLYVWAVANARVVEASMGYFLSPLIQISSGVVLFKERLAPLQWLAITFAAMGVGLYILFQGIFPWVGLGVGFSFAAYSILRKKIATGAVVGLYIETLMMAPFALLIILVLHYQHQAAFLNLSTATNWWLILGGLVTVTPLALFTIGTRQLPMASVGILFFITPSMQFIIGALVMGEPVNSSKLLAFSVIWAGVFLYSISILRNAKNPTSNY